MWRDQFLYEAIVISNQWPSRMSGFIRRSLTVWRHSHLRGKKKYASSKISHIICQPTWRHMLNQSEREKHTLRLYFLFFWASASKMHCWSMFLIRYSAEQLFFVGGGDVVSANCKFAHAVTHNQALTSRDRRNKREVANCIALEPQTAHFSSACKAALHWLVVVPGSHSHFPIALTHFSHNCENVQQSSVHVPNAGLAFVKHIKWNEIWKKNEVLYQTTQCFDHCISLKL